MYLLGLLVVPLLIGIVGTALGKGQLTWKELLVMEGGLIAIIAGTYGIACAIARWSAVADTEIWNGRISAKDHGSEQCCHSYECNCQSCNCDNNGNCSRCCDTCYEHSHDVWWNAHASTGDTVYSNGCNAPGTDTPARWNAIRVGEPAAVEHGFDNYILANPDTILRRTGAAAKFAGRLPAYPQTYDFYRVRPVLVDGVRLPPQLLHELNDQLNEINARLGARYQVNILLMLTTVGDSSYAEALNEHWVGGKKNDVIVVVGMPNYPNIGWVQVLSWTRAEYMKIAIRDGILDQRHFDGSAVLALVDREIRARFVRREMREFKYLLNSIEPPTWVIVLILLGGCAAAVGMARYFILNDPFGRNGGGGLYRRRKWR
jgi:hypothetical protein